MSLHWFLGITVAALLALCLSSSCILSGQCDAFVPLALVCLHLLTIVFSIDTSVLAANNFDDDVRNDLSLFGYLCTSTHDALVSMACAYVCLGVVQV